MYMVNIQLLSDRDYAKAIPDGFVINVKSVAMRKAIVQVAKRLDTDKAKVYHQNTDKFEKTHPDAVEGAVYYTTDPVTNHVDLVARATPATGITDALSAIVGRMHHRTLTLAARLEAQERKERSSKKGEVDSTAEEAVTDEEVSAEASAEE